MEGSLVAYKVFTNGSVLQASEINENLMRQSVMVFSNAAARTAAITVPLEGMLTWLEDLNRYDSYNGSAWVPAFGMTLLKAQTIGSAVSSVVVSDAFSADYDNYKIIVSGGVASAAISINMTLGAAVTNYNTALIRAFYSGGSVSGVGVSSGTSFTLSSGSTDSLFLNADLVGPFQTKNTYIMAPFVGDSTAGYVSGVLKNTTSFTAFTISSTGGTMTGGTIFVYGLKKA
jgi:hypothetical protein